jgi:hypothetical protein
MSTSRSQTPDPPSPPAIAGAAATAAPTTAAAPAAARAAAAAPAGSQPNDVLTAWKPLRRKALATGLPFAPWHEVRHQLKTIYDALSGRELVQWLISNNYAATIPDALLIGQALLGRRVIFPMLRRLAGKGFANDPDLFFMRTPARKERSVLSAALSGGPDVDTVAGRSKTPLMYVKTITTQALKEGIVEVTVQERQRRAGGNAALDGVWSAAKMLKTDPPAFSFKTDDVPVPAVLDWSPERCEWVGGWEPLRTTNAERPGLASDEEGWRYAVSFADEHVTAACVGLHQVRARYVVRRARKNTKPLEADRAVKAKAVEAAAAAAMSAEQVRQRELLERAAQFAAQKTRTGQLAFVIVGARDVGRAFDSHVVVECFTKVAKSGVAKKGKKHVWNFPGAMQLDTAEGVGIAMYETSPIGRHKLVGRAEFIVPEGEASGVENLPLLGDAKANTGNVRVEWQFELAERVSDARRDASLLFTERCIVSLDVQHAEGLLLPKAKSFCCMPTAAPKGRMHVVVKYRGELTNMTAKGPPVPSSRSPYWNWSTRLVVNYTQPILVEVWQVKDGERELFGTGTLNFSGRMDTDCTDSLSLVPPDAMVSRYIASLPAESPLNVTQPINSSAMPGSISANVSGMIPSGMLPGGITSGGIPSGPLPVLAADGTIDYDDAATAVSRTSVGVRSSAPHARSGRASRFPTGTFGRVLVKHRYDVDRQQRAPKNLLEVW